MSRSFNFDGFCFAILNFVFGVAGSYFFVSNMFSYSLFTFYSSIFFGFVIGVAFLWLIILVLFLFIEGVFPEQTSKVVLE